jgi:predicted transcriptional regulator
MRQLDDLANQIFKLKKIAIETAIKNGKTREEAENELRNGIEEIGVTAYAELSRYKNDKDAGEIVNKIFSIIEK